jgi:hypothetical protein
MNRRTEVREKDETATLHRIIADCVQSQFRYLPDRDAVDPHVFGLPRRPRGHKPTALGRD